MIVWVDSSEAGLSLNVLCCEISLAGVLNHSRCKSNPFRLIKKVIIIGKEPMTDRHSLSVIAN